MQGSLSRKSVREPRRDFTTFRIFKFRRIAQAVLTTCCEWTVRSWNTGGGEIFQVHPYGHEAHPASYTVSSGSLCRGVKWPGRDAVHPPPSSAGDEYGYIYPSACMACYRTALPLLNFVTNFHVLSEGYPPKFKLPFWFTVRTLMFVGQHSLRTCIFNFWFYNVLTIHRRMCIYIYIYTHTHIHTYTRGLEL